MKTETLYCDKDRSDILTGGVPQPLVSVIVPVYKVEDVLTRCLDSLCRQSLRDVEIILVDDASPDRCGQICEKYAAKDTRFRVVHHSENQGLSVARNTGIKAASAAYLMFVDSDDYVHEDFCRLPYTCAVQSLADLVMFRHQRIAKNDLTRVVKDSEGPGFTIITRLEAIEMMLHKVGNSAWNKLYSRKLFNTAFYPKGYFYEDVGTTYKTIFQADRICFLDKVLYFHCYHDGSITTLKTEKALRDWFKMHIQQCRDLAAWGYPADKLELLVNNTALTYCIRKKPDADDANYVFCRNALQSAKKIPEGFTWRRKVLCVLLKYCLPLFELVCKIWGKRW